MAAHADWLDRLRNDGAIGIIYIDFIKWSYTDNPVFVPDEMRAQPEPLIAEYEVSEWMNKAYRGSDQGRVCMPDLPARVRGLVRTVPLGSGGSNETDSEDKED